MPPKKKLKKGPGAAAATTDVPWEWKDDEGDWNAFAPEDAALLETRYDHDPEDVFVTTDFSFNKGYTTVYEVDLKHMTQTNEETTVCRAIRRDGVEASHVYVPSPLAKKKKKKAAAAEEEEAMPWEWKDDDETWHHFSVKDAAMLETKYLEHGPKSSFKTKGFEFNAKYKSPYEVDFAHMLQRNLSSGNDRKIRRGVGVKATAAVPWQWWSAEDKAWQVFGKKDASLLEAAFQVPGGAIFLTKDLSWNEEHQSQYIYDFTVMTQLNSDSGTSRKIRRLKPGHKASSAASGDAEASGYGAALSADFVTGSHTAAASGGSGGLVSFDFAPSLSATLIAQQKKLGAQSKRGGQLTAFGPAISKDKHGTMCFKEMLKNEATFSGEWVVSYHSYSAASLLYEVQAAVAAVLFRFKSQFATLPRLLYKPFEHIPNAHRMLEEFPKWKDRDHNPAFRGVGICGTSSLLAPDSEAPPKSVFLMGYSVGPLHGLLEKLLGQCGVPSSKVSDLAKSIIKLASTHGLDTCAFGGKPCKSGRSGHMLQIFVRRELCDDYVYPSFAYGVPDKKRFQPFSKYLQKDVKVAGQVRITANPDVFIRATCVRMFTFSADPFFHANRQDFQEGLTALLKPILGAVATRIKAAKGIFGGTLPSWWTPDDQGDASKMSASRYASSAL